MIKIDQEFQNEIKNIIRDIPNFPKEGILFRDITTLLQKGRMFNQVIDVFEEFCRYCNAEAIVAIESRGFIFGGALSDRLQIPFIPVRKEGKLPYTKETVSYSLEYGEESVEMHKDALSPGQKTVIIDDLLATGGTAEASASLVEKCGGEVAGIAMLLELSFLEGKKKLKEYEVLTMVRYDE